MHKNVNKAKSCCRIFFHFWCESVENKYIYCPFCGCKIQDIKNRTNVAEIPITADQENQVRLVFQAGIFLSKNFVFVYVSWNYYILQTLNARLRLLGLQRGNVEFEVNRVTKYIQEEIDGPGYSGGYYCNAHTHGRLVGTS